MARFLVAFDATPESENALRWIAGVAPRLGGEIAVAAVHRSEADTRAKIDTIAAGEPTLDSLMKVEVIDNATADALLDRTGPDVEVVLGVRARPERGTFAATADAVARHTTRPVLAIPAAAKPGVRRIVLGLDGSDCSAAAARWCASFASSLGIDVHAIAVHAQQYELLPESDPKSIYQYVKHSIGDEWIAPLRDAGVTVRAEVLKERRIPETLLTQAFALDAQLVVAGTQGLAPHLPHRLGSVASHLLSAHELPVVLVPQSST